jgi:hypothetical protein
MARPFDKARKLISNTIATNGVGLHKEFSVDMVGSFARPTPVDTGRATANWKAGINSEPIPNSNEFDKTPSATPTINKARSDLSGLRMNDEVIIKNAVSSDGEAGYIIKLENGHSQQAPTGMFRKNVIQAQRIADNTAKRIGL